MDTSPVNPISVVDGNRRVSVSLIELKGIVEVKGEMSYGSLIKNQSRGGVLFLQIS